MELKTALYLIPVGISDAPIYDVLPSSNIEIIRQIRFFIVENVRTARRFLKKCDPGFDIGACTFFELNRHTDLTEVASFIQPLREGQPVGVMSEAGCPAVADPGALPVSIAMKEGYKIIPLVGPSSILLALMASGFNGQGFCFHGYLPVEAKERDRKIKELETASKKNNITQIFIETPYRNNKMIHSLSSILYPSTMLCVAVDITDPEKEIIKSMPASKWKNFKENFDKHPAIFLIYAR